MMDAEQRKQKSYMRAKNRVIAIKKFYQHLVVYIAINCLISLLKINDYIDDEESLADTLSRFDIYIVWIIWGFFVLLQAIRTFKPTVFMGSDWEERKIQEYMNE